MLHKHCYQSVITDRENFLLGTEGHFSVYDKNSDGYFEVPEAPEGETAIDS